MGSGRLKHRINIVPSRIPQSSLEAPRRALGDPEALDVAASSLPSPAKIGKRGWTKRSCNGPPEAPWSPLAGSWAASKIDSRREQNRTPRGPKWRPGGLRGLLGARCAPDGRPGRSETACGRLLWPSGRLLGSSWGALGASWGPLGPPGGLPGGSRGSSGRSFWKVFLKSSPRSGKITRC